MLNEKSFFLASSLVEFSEERAQIGAHIQELNNEGIENNTYIRLEKCEWMDDSISQTRSQNRINRKIESTCGILILAGEQSNSPVSGKYTIEELDTALLKKKEQSDYQIKILVKEDCDSQALLKIFQDKIKAYGLPSEVIHKFSNEKELLGEVDEFIQELSSRPLEIVLDEKIDMSFGAAEEETFQDIVETLDLFNAFNSIYIRKGTFFQIHPLFIGKPEYTAPEIISSQKIFLLFYKQLVPEEIQLLEQSVRQYKQINFPKIHTYIKETIDKIHTSAGNTHDDADIIHDGGSTAYRNIEDFKNHLSSDHSYFYGEYSSTESLKLKMFFQVQLMQEVQWETLQGKLCVGDQEFIDLDKVGMFLNNKGYQELKNELEKARKEEEEARKLLISSNSIDNRNRYNQLASRTDYLQKQLSETERNTLEQFSKGLSSFHSNPKTDKIEKSLELLERGFIQEALRILNRDTIIDEVSRRKQEDKLYYFKRVNELLQRNRILISQPYTSDNDDEIICNFDFCFDLTREFQLPYQFVFEYLDYLHRHHQFTKAFDLIAELEKYFEIYQESISQQDRIQCRKIKGDLYYDHKDYKLACAEIQNCINILLSETQERNRNAFLAELYKKLGKAFSDTEKFDQAEKAFANALELFRELSYNQPVPYQIELASCQTSIAFLKQKSYKNKREAVLEEYRKAEKLFDEVIDKTTTKYKDEIAAFYLTFGLFYNHLERNREINRINGNYDKAKPFFLQSVAIREELSEVDREAYAPQLARSLNNLGNCCQGLQEFEEAEGYYLRSIEIRERLFFREPEAYALELSKGCANLASFYFNKRSPNFAKAQEYYQKAIDIQRQVHTKKNLDSMKFLADTYSQYGYVLRTIGNLAPALDQYKESIAVRRRLFKTDSQKFRGSLAQELKNISEVYRLVPDYAKDEASLLESIDILENQPELDEKEKQILYKSKKSLGYLHKVKMGKERTAKKLITQAKSPEPRRRKPS